jgi:hypothetical protein
MLPQIIDDLRNQGIDVSKGIPTGVTRNSNGDAILYFKGTELEPKYLMEVDTLIGRALTWEEIRNDFKGLCEETEYFEGFDWDVTPGGYVDILNRDNKFARHYHTRHKPTGSEVWYRKIEAETVKGVMVKIWERYNPNDSIILGENSKSPIDVIDI